jgi:membrane protein implicated in regulation of membrane protease activity
MIEALVAASSPALEAATVALQTEVFGIALSYLLVVAGAALVVMEALAPGAQFIVVGAALLVAGLVGVAVPPLAQPLILAGIMVATGVATFYGYRELDVYGGESAGTTRDASSLAGAQGVVTERVTETGGRVRLREGGFDPNYSARSVDGEIAEGEEVIVVDPGGGNVVTVQALESHSMDQIDRELARDREVAEPDPTGFEREDDAESETERN